MIHEEHIERLFIRTDSARYALKVEKEESTYYENKPENRYEPSPFKDGEVAHVLNLAMMESLTPVSERLHGLGVTETQQSCGYNAHFMVDIETLGTRPGDIVFELSCVRFDPLTGIDHQSWNQCFSIEFQKKKGLKIEDATKKWWLEECGRDPEAEDESEVYVPAQLVEFKDWLKKIAPKKKERRFWCRGANFDPVMLEPFFKAMGVDVPWTYWQWRDVRTLQGVLEAHGVTVDKPQGVAHNAYEDCIQQIAQVRELLALIGRTGGGQ